MAYQDDKYHRQAHQESWEHLLGYAVLGPDGDKIGTVKALWEDYTRQPAYLGIATSWLDMGGIHLVPAQFATVSERRQCLRLPFDAEVVKNAPQGHATDEITLSGETKIRDYYYRKGFGTGAGPGHAEPASVPIREDKPAPSPDWSAHDRRKQEEEESRSFRERVRDAVDEGKAKLAGEKEKDRPRDYGEKDGPQEYGRPEREMGLPFSEERPPLRKISHETPVAQPVLPREPETGPRPREEDEEFIPLRREISEVESRRRDDDREDRPLR
jgi:hypothetical protein